MNGVPNVTFATVGGTPPGQAGIVQGQTAAGAVPVGTAVTVNVYGPEAPVSSAPAAVPLPPGVPPGVLPGVPPGG
jgi:hypothetical protein